MNWLTESEIERLTGYKQAARQIKWLLENEYKFKVSGAGEPLVDADQFGVKSKVTKPKQPNFEAINCGQAA